MDIGLIYKISNKINGMCYIGKTKNTLQERLRTHFQKHSNCVKLKAAFEEFGIENFSIEILESNIPFNQLDLKEVYYIKLYDSVKNGYNIKEGNKNFKGRDFHIISNEIKVKVIQEYKNGVPANLISEHFKICLTSVYNILANTEKTQNIGYFNKGKAKIDFDLLVKLKREGKQTGEIAKYFGVAKSSVKRMINRHKNIIFPRVSDSLTSNVEVENVL